VASPSQPHYIITSPHVTSQPTPSLHLTSQPAHDITYHITTTDTPLKHTQPPPKRLGQTEWPTGARKKLCLGIRLVGRRAHILWANSFFGL